CNTLVCSHFGGLCFARPYDIIDPVHRPQGEWLSGAALSRTENRGVPWKGGRGGGLPGTSSWWRSVPDPAGRFDSSELIPQLEPNFEARADGRAWSTKSDIDHAARAVHAAGLSRVRTPGCEPRRTRRRTEPDGVGLTVSAS